MRSSRENEPWRSLNPSELSGPIEDTHVHRVHLGDTVAPFVLLEARYAVLPLQRGEVTAPWPGGESEVAGIDRTQLEYRMSGRWRDMSSIWDTHKSSSNKLSLIDRLDYHKGLSSQLKYCPIRLVYTTSGRPTAAVLEENDIIIDCRLFWLPCDTLNEAYYLAAIINSDFLYKSVIPMMPQGQYGARDLHKHLWKLPIDVYNSDNPIHRALARAGSIAADQAAEILAEEKRVRAAAGKEMTVGVARKTIRTWFKNSEVGQTIETHVEALLSG